MLKPKYSRQKNYHEVEIDTVLRADMPEKWLAKYPGVFVHQDLINGDSNPVSVDHMELFDIQTRMGLNMDRLPKTFLYHDDDELVLNGRAPESRITNGGKRLYINLATPGMISPDGLRLGRTLYRQYLELAHHRRNTPQLSARDRVEFMVASVVGGLIGGVAVHLAEFQQPTAIAAGAIIGGVAAASVVERKLHSGVQGNCDLTYLGTDPYAFSLRMPNAIRYLASVSTDV